MMSNLPHLPQKIQHHTRLTLAGLGLISLVAGCQQADVSIEAQANAQALPPPTNTPAPPPPTTSPTATATATPAPTDTPSPTVTPTPTPWPSPTPWPTATPWPTPTAWQPATAALPSLTPVPVVPTQAVANNGLLPVSYSPPDGVDVFGNTILRWEYYGQLAPDEFFDVKIKPLGSNDSVFVDWTKEPEYELQPWSGWVPGLYTWQIGIIKGHLNGETKEFVADTGRNSEPFVIKWQAGGGGDGGGGGGTGGGGSSGGS